MYVYIYRDRERETIYAPNISPIYPINVAYTIPLLPDLLPVIYPINVGSHNTPRYRGIRSSSVVLRAKSKWRGIRSERRSPSIEIGDFTDLLSAGKGFN